MVQAALAASAIGRGLPDTRMGARCWRRSSEFEHRGYSGSRVILLVSDGGAQLDEPTRERIHAGLAREKIGAVLDLHPQRPELAQPRTPRRRRLTASAEELALHDSSTR